MSPSTQRPPLHVSEAARRRAQRRRVIQARRRNAALAVIALVVLASALLLGIGSGGRPARVNRAGVRRSRAQSSKSTVPSGRAAGGKPTREDAAIDRLLARQPFISSGGDERREIALTFDDGPGPYTPRLLDELARLHTPATFFEIGFMIRYFHSSLTRELALGDAIGDHTETHPMMGALPASAQRAEILEQTNWLHRYGAPFPRLWRPPYGSYNPATLTILHRLGMLMVLWSVDTDDYLRPGVQAIVHRALAGARPGAIILMHDAGGNRSETTAALPLIVRALRARGYRLVTVPELITDDPPDSTQTLPAQVAGG